MAIFYAIRHVRNNKLLVEQNMGVGMRYLPTAATPADVDHLRHLVTFKSEGEAEEFIRCSPRSILNPNYEGALPGDLVIIPLEVVCL